MAFFRPTDQVVIQGGKVLHSLCYGGQNSHIEPQNETTIPQFWAQLAEQAVTTHQECFGIIPSGLTLRGHYRRGGDHVYIVEVAPGPRTMQWLRDDSPVKYGSGATYQDVILSMPLVYFFVTLRQSPSGISYGQSGVYFRTTPLTSMDDPLADCHFYNCSPDSYGLHCWICNQGYSPPGSGSHSPYELVQLFLDWFWFSGFNKSSEHHEGASFWSKNKARLKDSRVHTIAAWEKATKQDPYFALGVAWPESGYTPRKVCEELTAHGNVWQPMTASDFASVVQQCAL